MPYIKQELRHRGSKIGNEIRRFTPNSIELSPGPTDWCRNKTSFSKTGVSAFPKMKTYRQRKIIDPIYQHASYIPSPAQYSCHLEGPPTTAGG
jgi:hypothetical protein